MRDAKVPDSVGKKEGDEVCQTLRSIFKALNRKSSVRKEMGVGSGRNSNEQEAG